MNAAEHRLVPASRAKITAIGAYVPKQKLTNADLEKMVDTSDEWIVQRTGIRERRIARPDEFTSDLSVSAVRNLTETYGSRIDDVDLLLVCTNTPDFSFPSTASQVQAKLRIPGCGAVDLNATCAGFAYGLHMANGLISSGLHRKILVIGADSLSKVTDYTDRTTCILFGDGAGAVLVERDDKQPAFGAFHMGTEGEGGVHVYRTGLARQMNGKQLAGNGCIVQNGREVYRWAVSTVPEGMKTLVEKAGVSLSDVDWFIPHSANARIIESICEKTVYPIQKTLTSLEYFGNTSAATIPLSLYHGVRDGKIKKGDLLLAYGFGAGLVHAGLLFRWSI